MPSYETPKKNTAFIMYAGLPSRASPAIFKDTPTLAAGDFKVSIDGAALANLATLPTNTPGGKMVKFSLSSSEMNGDNITVVCSDAAGAEWSDVIINIQTSARQIDDLAYPTTTGRSIDVDASGGVEVGSFQAGAITAAAIATGAIDADAIAADAVAEIADGVWDEDATGHQTQGTFGQAIGDPVADTNTIYKAVVTDATGATVGVDVVAIKAETAAILADTDVIGATGGGLTSLASQASVTTIDDFLDTEIATIVSAVAAIETDTQDIQARLPAALVSGRIDASVGAMAANVMTAAAAAADLTTELQSGLATSASIAALNNLSAAQVNAEVVDALATDTYAEPGQGAPAATASLAAKINYLFKAWRNKKTVTATTFSLFADDASTVDQKSTVSDAAGTFTEGEKASGP